MKRGTFLRFGLILAAGVLFVGTSGCNALLVRTNIGSAVAGWLLGSITTASNAEHVCYQNGVLINCADLPEDLGQG